jgi:FtsZ-binding cell division protein ZapB
MPNEVGRSVDEMSDKIKALNRELKASADHTKQLDAALSFDVGGIDTLKAKLGSVQNTINLAAERLDLLREKYTLVQQKVQSGEMKTSELDKLTQQIKKSRNGSGTSWMAVSKNNQRY